MDPFDFADTITNFIRTGRVKSRFKQFISFIGKGFVLSPNVAGIGYDFKKLKD